MDSIEIIAIGRDLMLTTMLLVVVILVILMLGDWLRDVLNPKLYKG